jgi:hypothetical protein
MNANLQSLSKPMGNNPISVYDPDGAWGYVDDAGNYLWFNNIEFDEIQIYGSTFQLISEDIFQFSEIVQNKTGKSFDWGKAGTFFAEDGKLLQTGYLNSLEVGMWGFDMYKQPEFDFDDVNRLGQLSLSRNKPAAMQNANYKMDISYSTQSRLIFSTKVVDDEEITFISNVISKVLFNSTSSHTRVAGQLKAGAEIDLWYRNENGKLESVNKPMQVPKGYGISQSGYFGEASFQIDFNSMQNVYINASGGWNARMGDHGSQVPTFPGTLGLWDINFSDRPIKVVNYPDYIEQLQIQIQTQIFIP